MRKLSEWHCPFGTRLPHCRTDLGRAALEAEVASAECEACGADGGNEGGLALTSSQTADFRP